MAIQVINDPYRSLGGSLGASLGQGLGSGLSSGLEALAQQKLTELASRQQQAKSQQGFTGIGYTPQEAAALSLLPESLQKSYLSNYGPLEQPAGLEQQLAGLGGAQGSPMAQQTSAPEATTPEGVGAAPITQPEQPKRRLTREQEKQAKLEEHREKKLALEERKATAAEQARINRETQDFYKKTLEDEKTAKETKITLDKMEKLINKGNLPPAALYKLVKDIEDKVPPTHGAAVGGALGGYFGGPVGAAVGGGIGALIGPIASLVESGIKYAYPDTEQFEKLSNSFIKGAKAIFGQRITDQDLRVFLTTLPNLTQTENGKRQIINNIRILNQAADARAAALKEILKESGGKRPENLPILVEERANKELDKLAQEFSV